MNPPSNGQGSRNQAKNQDFKANYCQKCLYLLSSTDEFDNNYQIDMAQRIAHYKTTQKQAIMQWMQGAKNHPTAEDVYNGVKEKLPKISFATVYRNLQKLVEELQIKEVQFVDKKKRYEAHVADHQHFICLTCQRIIDMELSKLLNVEEISQKLQCHRVDGFNLELMGLCAACRTK